MFFNKSDEIFSSPHFSFKILEDDGRSVVADATFQRRQVGVVTLASEAIRGTFEIVDGDVFGVFEIDADTGLITTTKSVDRERQPTFHLKVVVAVFGSKTFSECSVRVDVEDLVSIL
jgi:Cadherin domain